MVLTSTILPFELNPKWETVPVEQFKLLVSLAQDRSEWEEVNRLAAAARIEGDRIEEMDLIRRANELKLFRSNAEERWYPIPIRERESIIHRNVIRVVLPTMDQVPRLLWRK